MAATAEQTRHIILHTHDTSGKDIFAPFNHPEEGKSILLDLDEAKDGAAMLMKKHKGHKFAAYTLVKR